MKRRFLVKSLIIVFLISIIFMIENYSYASSFKFNAEADKTEVDPGEEVTIELNVSEIDMGEHGINVVEGYLDYDKDFFSEMKFENVNDWNITYNNEDGERKGKFLIVKMVDGIKEPEKINKIIIKVRSDITEGEGHIRLKNIQSNDGKNLIDEGDRIITKKIKQKDSPKNEVSNEIDNKVKNETGNKIENKINNENQSNTVNNSESSKEEPNTKNSVEKIIENAKTSDNIIFIVLGMVTVIAVNIVIFIINKKSKEKDKEE